jgi:DnaJ-class molecular chaperone
MTTGEALSGEQAEVCHRCHGTGDSVTQDDYALLGGPCPECHGTGRVVKEVEGG